MQKNKIVIAGSLKFCDEIKDIASILEKKNYKVLDYSKADGRDYKQVLKDFYLSIDKTDVLLVYNKEKNGIDGYIGSSCFSEINHAILNNLLYDKDIKIYLLNDIDKNNTCYDEIKYYIDNDMINVLNISQKELLNIK